MKPETEELLHSLLWCMDVLANPTFRNLTDSYESWLYRRGFQHQINRLERARLLERQKRQAGDSKNRLYRLTALGRLRALGGRDPQARWARPWDGLWRWIAFDVPMSKEAHRHWLRRYLAGRGFGCLQGSVWVTPEPMEQERQHLVAGNIHVNSLILLEGRACAGETDEKIVAGAWDFDTINQRYERYMKILRERPGGNVANETEAKLLRAWADSERKGWWRAVSSDPLLPECLLPVVYLGKEAWRQRLQTLRLAGRQIQGFGH
jgi:phenylacetic acid degradation operon negative regulatory protein